MDRIANLDDIKHASQAVAVYGDLQTTTLYSSHINTCIGLVVVCPETKRAAVVHISDYFVGILASEREWGQLYMQELLKRIFEKTDPAETGSHEVMLVGGTDLNTDDQIYEKLFLALGLYAGMLSGRNFFADFEHENMEAIFEREEAKKAMAALDETEDLQGLKKEEKRFKKAGAAVHWPPADHAHVLQFKQLSRDEFAMVVANISSHISEPVMAGGRRLSPVGVLWVKNVLARGQGGRALTREEVRDTYYPRGMLTDAFRKFQHAQIEGVHALFDYLANLQTDLSFNVLQHSNIQERVEGRALSVAVHCNTTPEILIWREDVAGRPSLFVPNRRQAYRVQDYSLGHNEPTLRRLGVFMMADEHREQLERRDMITVPLQDEMIRKYVES